MSAPLVVALPGAAALAARLVARLPGEAAAVELRAFPDGETYVRLDTDPAGRVVVLAAELSRPDPKLVTVLLAAETARELGARRVVLAAPYLPYMRQDARFRPGEGVTSVYVGRLLSRVLDGLVTVDPHLHRHASLDAVYSVPSRVVRAAPAIARHVLALVARPLFVGPDEESAQWVASVAGLAGAPHVVLTKTRAGDRDVRVSVPDLERWRDRTPVLVDDIISTARTLIATLHHLRAAGLPPALCAGVHAVFAGDAHQALLAAGPAGVVTCDTIPHVTNAIDLGDDVARAVLELLRAGPAAATEEPGLRRS